MGKRKNWFNWIPRHFGIKCNSICWKAEAEKCIPLLQTSKDHKHTFQSMKDYLKRCKIPHTWIDGLGRNFHSVYVISFQVGLSLCFAAHPFTDWIRSLFWCGRPLPLLVLCCYCSSSICPEEDAKVRFTSLEIILILTKRGRCFPTNYNLFGHHRLSCLTDRDSGCLHSVVH